MLNKNKTLKTNNDKMTIGEKQKETKPGDKKYLALEAHGRGRREKFMMLKDKKKKN